MLDKDKQSCLKLARDKNRTLLPESKWRKIKSYQAVELFSDELLLVGDVLAVVLQEVPESPEFLIGGSWIKTLDPSGLYYKRFRIVNLQS
jgi:hypothetical protein